MALEHFKPTRMHLWQVGCTGNLMTDHVIPWNGGLVLFSAAGLLPRPPAQPRQAVRQLNFTFLLAISSGGQSSMPSW